MRLRHPPIPLLYAILLVVTAGCGPADDAQGAPLWKGSFQGKPLTILGTIHSLPLSTARATWPELSGLFEARGTLFVESDAESMEAQQTFASSGRRFSWDPDLDTELTAEEWRTLVEATRALVPETALKRARPWFASLLYTSVVAPVVDDAGRPIRSMDLELVDEARKAGVEVRFLESTFAATFALDRATTPQVLKATLALSPDGHRAARKSLEQAWLRGDMKTLARSVDELEPARRKELFDTRNVVWGVDAPKLVEDVPGPVFIAVGAGHLVTAGSRSFPEVLRLYGATLSR